MLCKHWVCHAVTARWGGWKTPIFSKSSHLRIPCAPGAGVSRLSYPNCFRRAGKGFPPGSKILSANQAPPARKTDIPASRARHGRAATLSSHQAGDIPNASIIGSGDSRGKENSIPPVRLARSCSNHSPCFCADSSDCPAGTRSTSNRTPRVAANCAACRGVGSSGAPVSSVLWSPSLTKRRTRWLPGGVAANSSSPAMSAAPRLVVVSPGVWLTCCASSTPGKAPGWVPGGSTRLGRLAKSSNPIESRRVSGWASRAWANAPTAWVAISQRLRPVT